MNSVKITNKSNSFNLKYHTLFKNNHNNNKLLKSLVINNYMLLIILLLIYNQINNPEGYK